MKYNSPKFNYAQRRKCIAYVYFDLYTWNVILDLAQIKILTKLFKNINQISKSSSLFSL